MPTTTTGSASELATVIDAWLAANRERTLNDLCELLRIPSVSTNPAYAPHMRRAAEHLVAYLERLGFTASVCATQDHPVVYAQHLKAGQDKPTILIYGHYDVQPPEPLELWITPPFEPNIRDGKVFARGACDNKGQLVAQLSSLAAHIESHGGLPVNVKVVIEGAEESGGDGLARWVRDNAERLACDVVVVSDTGMLGPNQPAITAMLRGLVYFEVVVQGPNRDLHSGSGNTVANPLTELVRLLASMQDGSGRVLVPGFYDDVLPISELQRAEWQALEAEAATTYQRVGAPRPWGEPGFTTLERQWGRPSFDIHGITGGYSGPGSKTVIPAYASAKFSCRLVANQNPETLSRLIESHLRAQCPPTVTLQINRHSGARPLYVDRHHPAMRAAEVACERGFGAKPVFVGCGGSIPILSDFADCLHAPTVLVGFSLPDDGAHSPNEKFELSSFYGGIRTAYFLLHELARLRT